MAMSAKDFSAESVRHGLLHMLWFLEELMSRGAIPSIVFYRLC